MPRKICAFRSYFANAGDLAWDRKFLGEAEMARDPFYADFLAGLGFRYFISAVLEKTPDKLVVVAVQRTRKQGHVDRQEIALMRRLCPHLQRAYDTATRLKSVAYHRGLLENALAWLCDGVALLRADGHVVYANDALLAIAQCGDGFRVANGTVEFPTVEARRHFDAALGATQRIGNAFFDACPTDFPVPRTTGMPAYIMSLRPLVRQQSRAAQHDDAVVMLFVRDPLGRNIVASHMLQELFNLTDAEAHLAQALCTGKTTDAYAEERSVTLNTVYSHLRRIREKTGCKSVPDLIRKFSELNIPLRTN
jgi:DNA-binding CsgD family transcriptional regulator/PAS domain-containing protein